MTTSEEILQIDGSIYEGGGQILRNAIAFSCLLRRPVRVWNIRAGRSNAGLRSQHMTGIKLISAMSNGRLDGATIGSTEITFYPATVKAGRYEADTQTAGSVCLLMQAAVPCMVFGNGSIELRLLGGTNAEMAPQIDYQLLVFKPIAAKFGLYFDCDIERRGYYPKGGGEVYVRSEPVKYLKPVTLTDVGHVTSIYGRSFVSGQLPPKVARLMADTAKATLKQKMNNIPIKMDVVKEPNPNTASGIILVAETTTGCLLAGSGLGKRGRSAEDVGYQAASSLLDNIFHGGCVDDYLQDQLIILMALAKGKSSIRCGPLTLHTETAIHVAKQLTQAKFDVVNLSQTQTIIECEGIGLENVVM
ncbi:3' [Octopus vulgaris]|uniref:3&apos n=2 Tax=Octopus TaxID=6643 RepID=A0AA36BN01_OCTVU|nr:RNA 3'-terminal phosphate cyclase [Octopus sinensis]CAI9736737.1 3' [Octopus vulgaris]